MNIIESKIFAIVDESNKVVIYRGEGKPPVEIITLLSVIEADTEEELLELLVGYTFIEESV